MSRRYIVSPDEIAAAREIPLLPLLERRGYALKKDGRYYRLAEHDSVVIDPARGRWHWNSQGIKNANTVDWLCLMERRSLPDAVHELLDGAPPIPPKRPAAAKQEKGISHLPQAHTDDRRVFAYLVKTRCLDPAVVRENIQAGRIYESALHHNAVFVRRDEDGCPAGYFERGTLTGSRYKHDPAGSDKRWGFLLPGHDPRLLYITEAAIDALSIETLRRRQRLPPDRFAILSLGGNAADAAKWYLSRRPAEIVCICTDSDAGGEVGCAAVRALHSGTVLRAAPPKKDWNEVCQSTEKPEYPFRRIETERWT